MDWYSVCVAFNNLKMYPVFELVNYVLMAMNMRADLQKMVPFNFPKRHPLASWLSTMMLCYAGGIFSCLLFGKPWATLFVDPIKMLTATGIWYAVNYTPGDIVFNVCSSRFGKTIIIGMKEIHRTYGVYGGVLEASQLYPQQYLLHFVVGFLKGAAAEIMVFGSRACAGILRPAGNQFMTPNIFLWPSSVFKASAALSLAFLLEYTEYVTVDHNIYFTCVFLPLLYFRIAMIWGIMGDPFIPLENLVCSILFGGMVDAFKRVTDPERVDHAQQNGDTKVKKH